MKKQTKKQTAAKRPAAKPRQVKPKAVTKAVTKAKPKSKSKAAVKATSKNPKPVVAKKPLSTKPKAAPKKSKPVVKPHAPLVAEPVTAVVSVVAAVPSPYQPVPNQSEMEELRRIELAIADAEKALAGNPGQAVTINSVSAVTIADVAELLEELIDTASPKLASTISRLAYVLCGVIPGLQAISKRADIALCRKCGVTFGWDRQAEAERAVRSGKYQKTITIS